MEASIFDRVLLGKNAKFRIVSIEEKVPSIDHKGTITC